MGKKKDKISDWFFRFRTWVVGIAAVIVALSVISAFVYPKLSFVWNYYAKNKETNARINKLENKLKKHKH